MTVMDDTATLLALADRMLWITALAAAPVLLATLAIGLVVGVIQAATSINEQTLTFVPKLAVTALVLVVFGASMMALVGDFTRDVFDQIADRRGVGGDDESAAGRGLDRAAGEHVGHGPVEVHGRLLEQVRHRLLGDPLEEVEPLAGERRVLLEHVLLEAALADVGQHRPEPLVLDDGRRLDLA